jgi:hypothetical protein
MTVKAQENLPLKLIVTTLDYEQSELTALLNQIKLDKVLSCRRGCVVVTRHSHPRGKSGYEHGSV